MTATPGAGSLTDQPSTVPNSHAKTFRPFHTTDPGARSGLKSPLSEAS